MKSAIIGFAMLLAGSLLTGCSALRLGYGNGPQLAWWWIDGYFDFASAQAPDVKRGIGRWFEWHRATQLPEYAALLAAAQAQVLEPTTAAQACQWQARVRTLAEPALQRAVSEFAEIVPGLGEPQFRHLEQKHAKAIDEMRDEFLQPDAAERQRASVERAVERAERVYGRLAEPQRRVIAQGVAASPFDPELWLKERQRRQRDAVQTLRRLAADKPDRDTRIAALRGLLERSERSPDAGYRAYQVRLGDYNCALAAQIHNATTPAQRLKARENLKGWEEDLRALLAPG